MIPRSAPPQFEPTWIIGGVPENDPGTRIVTLHTFDGAGSGDVKEYWVCGDVNAVMTGALNRYAEDSSFPTNGYTWAQTVAWYQQQGFSGQMALLHCVYTQISSSTPSSSGPSGTAYKLYNGTAWNNATHKGSLLRSVSGTNYTDLIVLFSGWQSAIGTNKVWYEKGASNTSRSDFVAGISGLWSGGKWCNPTYAWSSFR
jgi:hypothetical protein